MPLTAFLKKRRYFVVGYSVYEIQNLSSTQDFINIKCSKFKLMALNNIFMVNSKFMNLRVTAVLQKKGRNQVATEVKSAHFLPCKAHNSLFRTVYRA